VVDAFEFHADDLCTDGGCRAASRCKDPAMSYYSVFKDLPLKIESGEFVRHELAVSSGFDRVTTEIVLKGDGHEGRGEDVTYDTLDHDVLQLDAKIDFSFDGTFDEFSKHLLTLPLWAAPPVREPSVNYRLWGFESAALDLALRQSGLTFDEALGIEPQPVRFILSLRLGDPPDIARVNNWLAVAPWLEFKLDAENSWPHELLAELGASGKVASVDLKGLYVGTEVDNPPTERLYKEVVELFPDAWIEDPAFIDETRPILETALDRLTWDAPIHSVADIEGLEFAPEGMNIKPSRFGPLSELLAVIEYCEAHDIEMYSGGQFELSVGRSHLHVIASVFFPGTPNDAAPVHYHGNDPVENAPSSPLAVPAKEDRAGFSWPL
jgi:L-alanine-DL-glutamate epimerase-like enolase superfamily enzyme